MYRLLIFILLLVPLASHTQSKTTNSEEYEKAKEYFDNESYDLAYNYIQIVKLTNQVPIEESSILEIKILYHSKKYTECMDRLNFCMSNVNYSLTDLTAISEIKTKIQNDKAFQKRVAVEKLKVTEKIKNENSSWNSVMDKAKNSLKSIINN